jgi:hypothetical protein
MAGYPNGDFKPEGNITRAEFAKIAVMAMGYGEAAKASEGVKSSKFKDVPAGKWYTGYVNVAENRGLISGYADGTFKPNGNLTNQEAITILVRMVGLGPVVDKAGVWPTNYIGRASNEGILDDVKVVGNVKATRGDVAIMLTNSLTVDMWGAAGYEDDGSVDYGKLSPKETLLADRLDVTEVDVRVTKYDTDDNELTIQAIEDEDDDINGNYEIAKDADVDLYNAFLNEVTVWVDEDDEIIFGDIYSDFFLDAVEINDKCDEVTLVGADKKYDIDEDAEIFIDTKSNDVDDIKKIKKDEDREFGYAKVVLNDKNDVIFMDIYDWTEFHVVKSTEKDVVKSIEDEELNTEDYTIFKDGKIINASDVEEGDIFFFTNAEDGFAEVYNNTVEGKIEKVYSDAIKVDSTEYDFEDVIFGNQDTQYLDDDELANFDKDVADDMKTEDEVTLYLERDGDMIYIAGKMEDNSSDMAGILYKNVATDVAYNKTSLEFKFVNEESKAIRKTVKQGDIEKITVDGKVYEEDELIEKADGKPIGSTEKEEVDKFKVIASADNKTQTLYAILKNGVKKEIGVIGDSDIFNAGSVINFTYDENGEVIELEFFDANEARFKDTLDITKDKYVKGKKLTSKTVIFNIEDCVNDNKVSYDDEDISAVKLGEADFEEISGDEDVESIAYFDKDKEVQYIVAAKTDKDEDTTDFMGLVTNVRTNSDDEAVEITAWVDGKETKYDVDELKNIDEDDEKKVYILTVQDEDSLVTEVKEATLAKSGEVAKDGVNTTDDKITIDKAYALASDVSILDYTDTDDDPEKKYLRDIEAGDIVSLYFDDNTDEFIKIVLLKDEADNNAGDDINANGKIDFIDTAASEVTIDGETYDTVGEAKAFLTELKKVGNYNTISVAYKADSKKKIYDVTAIELGDTSYDADQLNNLLAAKVEFNGLVIDGKGSSKTSVTGTLNVMAESITLQDMTIENLTINSSVSGDFTTNNVVVTGKTSVDGGGSKSVHFNNTKLNTVSVSKPDVRVVFDNVDVVGKVIVSKDAKFEADASTSFKEIEVTAGTLKLKGTVNVKEGITGSGSVDTSEATVADEKDATLAELTVDGKKVAGFAADTTNYSKKLAVGTTNVPVVAGKATNPKATVKVTQAADTSSSATVEVTAVDGTTTKTYTVSFSVEADKSEATVKVNGAGNDITAGAETELEIAGARTVEGLAIENEFREVVVTSDDVEVFKGNVAIIKGVGTFTIATGTITKAGASIDVTIEGVKTVTESLAVIPAEASKLVIKTQPTAANRTSGDPIQLDQQPVINIVDEYGNLVDSSGSVKIAKAGSETWALAGTTTVNAVGGTATFTNLTTQASDNVTGATVKFTSGDLTSVTSNAFNITD